ncbi:hypothetical protein L873DRAFT_36459 [Choiromyces venosus 120613-1]|uniref:Uncharacterized protein n=1 Tax=Choiromyces venosus 120613-1 TaxID=1336337 RepID=A0A3N4K327_9PEZI|nr:hypothetical protein L873DRAFT_36459 [Choiromyces venosus 120613-1]
MLPTKVHSTHLAPTHAHDEIFETSNSPLPSSFSFFFAAKGAITTFSKWCQTLASVQPDTAATLFANYHSAPPLSTPSNSPSTKHNGRKIIHLTTSSQPFNSRVFEFGAPLLFVSTKVMPGRAPACYVMCARARCFGGAGARQGLEGMWTLGTG